MALYNPPPPPLLTTGNTIPSSSNLITQQPDPHSSPSSTSTASSIIIVIIIISSAILISASLYLLLRFLSNRSNHSVRSFPSNDVVSENIINFPERRNENENENEYPRQHVINIDKTDQQLNSLPSFTFSSLTGCITGGDCAVCLSKFEPVDQLRLLPLCCHAFHAECIDLWLKSHQTCPLCRSTVNPTEDDVISKILSVSDRSHTTEDDVRSDSFRIEIGSVNRRRTPSDSGRRSYAIGSFEYVLDDGYEVPVESTHRIETSDKDLTAPTAETENLAAEIGGDGGGSGRLNWLRDYVDRVSESVRGSGRFFAGSSRRSEVVTVEEYDGGGGGGGYSRVGEEISELFRWLSGV